MAGANFHKENEIPYNLTNSTINIVRNKQFPMMSPSTLAEDYFDTLGRHISTYNTRNTIQGTNPPPYPHQRKVDATYTSRHPHQKMVDAT